MNRDAHLVNGSPWTVEVEHLLVPAKGHDRYLADEDFLGVADGATPLCPDWPDPGPFAAAALEALRAECAAPVFDLRAVFERAIRRAGGRGPVLSCAVAVAMRHGADLIIAVLGDCTAVMSLGDGRTVTVVDRAVSRRDAAALGGPGGDIGRRLLENRLAMNREDSYWVFADQLEAAAHVLSATAPVGSVTSVQLFTDGYGAHRGVDDSTVLRARPAAAPPVDNT